MCCLSYVSLHHVFQDFFFASETSQSASRLNHKNEYLTMLLIFFPLRSSSPFVFHSLFICMCQFFIPDSLPSFTATNGNGPFLVFFTASASVQSQRFHSSYKSFVGLPSTPYSSIKLTHTHAHSNMKYSMYLAIAMFHIYIHKCTMLKRN